MSISPTSLVAPITSEPTDEWAADQIDWYNALIEDNPHRVTNGPGYDRGFVELMRDAHRCILRGERESAGRWLRLAADRATGRTVR